MRVFKIDDFNQDNSNVACAVQFILNHKTHIFKYDFLFCSDDYFSQTLYFKVYGKNIETDGTISNNTEIFSISYRNKDPEFIIFEEYCLEVIEKILNEFKRK